MCTMFFWIFVLLHVRGKIFLYRQQFSHNCLRSWFVIFLWFTWSTWKNKIFEHVIHSFTSYQWPQLTLRHPSPQRAVHIHPLFVTAAVWNIVMHNKLSFVLFESFGSGIVLVSVRSSSDLCLHTRSIHRIICLAALQSIVQLIKVWPVSCRVFRSICHVCIMLSPDFIYIFTTSVHLGC